jgi:tRNA1Val (adenine37-N6)-methyltransferase
MKSGTYFHFKQFTIRHDRCAMKVGTDAVVLGAWVDVSNVEKILDIGTGSGVIALMLAQRTETSTRLECVEIEKNSADQATDNVNSSRWSSRIDIHQIAVQDYFPATRFDLIVTNPPYFNKSLKPQQGERQQVRHTSSLSYEELLSAVVRLLASNGRFNVILPYQEAIVFSGLAARHHLCCNRRYYFKTRREKSVERTLLEFSTNHQSLDEGEIILYDDGLDWSASYRQLISDFYIRG